MKRLYSETDDTTIKLKVLAKKKENTRRKLVVTAKKLRLKAKKLALTAEKKENVRNKLVVTAEEKENVRNKLVITAKQLAMVAKEKENIRKKLAVTAEALRLKAKQLAMVAKEKENVRNKLVVTAKQLAMVAKEKENVRNKLVITAKQLAMVAKEKENVRNKLVVTAKQLAMVAKEKENVRNKLVVTAKQLAMVAKEKENIRKKLAITAEALRLKAKQLATVAKEKENVRNKLVVTAKQLAMVAKEKESIRKKLAVTAEALRLKAEQLALVAKEKESIRKKLAVTAEALRLKAEQLALVAKEKENIRKRLAVTAEALRLKAENIEQVEAKEEAILASIDDGVVACDKNGRVTLFNKAAEILTGLSAKEAIGQQYSYSLNFIRESDEKESDDLIGLAIAQGRATKMASHTMLIKKNGYKISVSDSIAPIRNSQKVIIGCVIVFRDATQESKIDKAKTEFVSLASHQLRTPLTTVNWYSEMLLTGDAGPLNKKQREYIDEIYKGSKRMGNLVNALLDVSRMEMGTFTVEPEPTDIPALVQSVADELRPQIDKKNLKFSGKYADNLPVVNADPKLLRMVFQNILSNAVKYTPDNGNINLELSLSDAEGLAVKTKEQKLNIMVKVSDTGYGIPQINQSKIFTKFFRGDNVRAKDTEGTGLGLYIVKGIVDQSGGQIWFESKEGEGTTFYLTLPIEGMRKRIGTNTLT